MRPLDRSAARIINRNSVASPIDKKLLSSFVFLAQHDILLAAPALIQLAETGVAIAVWMSLPVLLPQQLLGHMCMLLPLPVQLGEVRHRQYGGPGPWRTPKQGRLQPAFMPILSKRPRHSGGFGSLQIFVSGSKADRATAGDCSQPQAQLKSQSKNFFDLAHGQSPRWHADPPFSWGGCLPLCCPAPL